MTIHTIGHSTRPLEAFLALLHAHGIRQLVDVRAIPRSRRHPQFDRDALAASLPAAGIAYLHLPGLGGRRTARPESVNTAWRSDGFRGYADYMQTAAFTASLQALLAHARHGPTAYMCAEAVPAHCHRSLISDALVVRGAEVRHIVAADRADPHAMTAFARVDGTRITYPATGQQNLPLTGA